MDYEAFLELVKRRRSIRRLKPDPIPDEYIEKILEAARWAPSGANSQPWEYIVVKDKKLKDKIVEFYGEHQKLAFKIEQTRPPEERMPRFNEMPKFPPSFAVAPVFILLVGDPRTKDAYPLSSVLDYGGSHFYSSLANTFLYMHLAATALGLGTQWVSATHSPAVECFIKQLLDIPQELEVYDMIVLGYIEKEPDPRCVRPLEEIVHHDYYDRKKFQTARQVKDFIRNSRLSITDFRINI